MSIDRQSISIRLDELMGLGQSDSPGRVGEITSGTINILEKLYGPESEKLKAYIRLYDDYVKNPNKESGPYRISNILHRTVGVLKSIKSEVESGLVGNLELEA